MISRCALLALLALTGCAPSVIERNVDAGASLSIGNSPNSGFLYKTREDGQVVSVSFNADGHDWYEYLLGRYGKNLKPPRSSGFGVTHHVADITLVSVSGARVAAGGTVYTLNREAADDLILMATWARSDEHPQKTLLQKVGL